MAKVGNVVPARQAERQVQGADTLAGRGRVGQFLIDDGDV
jgi:hypothetical protein